MLKNLSGFKFCHSLSRHPWTHWHSFHSCGDRFFHRCRCFWGGLLCRASGHMNMSSSSPVKRWLTSLRLKHPNSLWVIDRFWTKVWSDHARLAAMIAQKYAENLIFHSSNSRTFFPRCHQKPLQWLFQSYASSENHYQRRLSQESNVAYPLRLYDCAPITDGASAIILTSQPTPIKVSGIGHATDTAAVRHRASFTSFNSTKEAAQKAYIMSQLNPSDIQWAEVHDAFTLFEIIGTEDLGFFPPGKGWKALKKNHSFRGRLPINPSGGWRQEDILWAPRVLLRLVEIIYQLRGEAGRERQLERAEIGLAQSIGGLGNNNLVTILERADRKRIVGKGWSPDYHPEINVSKKMSTPPPEGIGFSRPSPPSMPPGRISFTPRSRFVKTEGGKWCWPAIRITVPLKSWRWGKRFIWKTREGLYVLKIHLLEPLETTGSNASPNSS